MIKDLPVDLLQASAAVLIASDAIAEDTLGAMDIPDEDAEPQELSGEQEEVIINPEYRANRGPRIKF